MKQIFLRLRNAHIDKVPSLYALFKQRTPGCQGACNVTRATRVLHLVRVRSNMKFEWAARVVRGHQAKASHRRLGRGHQDNQAC